LWEWWDFLFITIKRNNLNFSKYYKNKSLIIAIQILTILLIGLVKIDLVLKLMLVFGYVMLFRQERWHKHIFIMLLMVLIMFIASGGFSTFMIK
jgi:hypothetical protein